MMRYASRGSLCVPEAGNLRRVGGIIGIISMTDDTKSPDPGQPAKLVYANSELNPPQVPRVLQRVVLVAAMAVLALLVWMRFFS